MDHKKGAVCYLTGLGEIWSGSVEVIWAISHLWSWIWELEVALGHMITQRSPRLLATSSYGCGSFGGAISSRGVTYGIRQLHSLPSDQNRLYISSFEKTTLPV